MGQTLRIISCRIPHQTRRSEATAQVTQHGTQMETTVTNVVTKLLPAEIT